MNITCTDTCPSLYAIFLTGDIYDFLFSDPEETLIPNWDLLYRKDFALRRVDYTVRVDYSSIVDPIERG